jgi:hypothetical protein
LKLQGAVVVTHRWTVHPRYVNGFPDSPIGAGLSCLLPSPQGAATDPPLAHSVEKFSHARGATSQYNRTTIRFPQGVVGPRFRRIRGPSTTIRGPSRSIPSGGTIRTRPTKEGPWTRNRTLGSWRRRRPHPLPASAGNDPGRDRGNSKWRWRH